MMLLPLSSRIEIPNTYPDKVRIHLQYSLSDTVPYDEVMGFFHDLGFVSVSRKPLLRDTIEGNQSGFLFDVTVTYAPQVSRLHVYVDLNPLRFIHAYAGSPCDETSINRDNNWLPENTIQERNDRALAVTDYLIWEAEEQITELVERFSRSRGDSTLGIYQGASLAYLEVAVDLGADDPLAAIDAIAPYFRQHIRQTNLSGYRPLTTSYETYDDDSRMVHGYLFRHERYKAYVKTNRRLRIECEFKSDAFSRLGINRRISDDENSFRTVFEQAASHCLEVFNSVLESCREDTSGGGGRSVLEFLLSVGQVSRDPQRAQTFVQTLAHTGRITSSFGYPYLRPFIDHGLIHRTGHGIYAAASEWQSAVSELGTKLGNLTGEAVQ